MKKNCISLFFSATILVFALNANARENLGGSGNGGGSNNVDQSKSLMSSCVNATAQVDLDINNVRAKILNGGDMWWDIFGSQNAAYQVPKLPSGKIGPSSQFASSIWVGGYDAGGNLKCAAQTYRQNGNDYWPGPLTSSATTDAATCLNWDKFFKINRSDVETYFNWVTDPHGPNPVDISAMDVINNWPAFGPDGQPMAPFYDYNHDGFYDPSQGDVPDFDITKTKRGCAAQLFGDQNIFWVFNDKGNLHTETGCDAIGLEIQAQAFAFSTSDEINNATFLKYKIINKSSFRIDSTFFGLWDDADLGDYSDDLVGCDVGLGLGILYNGDAVDGSGQPDAYGANPPAVGVDFFEGPYKDPNGLDDSAYFVPKSFLNYGDGNADNERLGMCKFVYFINDNNPINGNPSAGDDFYQYLTGTYRNGAPMTYGGNGITGTIPCDYMFPGSSDQGPQFFGTHSIPVSPWDAISGGLSKADMRFIESAGPFKLQPGAVNYVTVGMPWARATQGGNLASVALLKGADAKLQQLFNNCFSTLDGPTAPNLRIQELDQEIILSWSNPSTSNNANENYSEDYDKSTNVDSLYRFQGYLVYQLKDAGVSQTELNNVDKARLVLQCDKVDEVSQIVNYTNDIGLSALVPTEMVNGSNKGIVHSVAIKEDKFATGNTRLINHKTYYYAIVAYGYSPTQVPTNLNQLNDYLPFIAGRKNADGPSFIKHPAIPHIPSPESSGTITQSVYGYGPKLKRMEGQGNGGNIIDLTQGSVDQIMSSSDSRILHPVYENGKGPVTIKVVDPLNVAYNSNMRIIIKPTGTGSARNITTSSTWDLVNLSTGDTVHSETTIEIPNEQIINGQPSGNVAVIPKWGISVNVVYTFDPGGGVGAVNNSFLDATISFSDPSKQWLTGISDQDGETEFNWIRSGTETFPGTPSAQNPHTGSAFNDYAGKDDGQDYEKVVKGTWAPYRLCGVTTVPGAGVPIAYRGGPAINLPNAMARNLLKFVSSVDVIITSDQSKWTRCPVIELQEEASQSIGNTKKMYMRKSPSVDKNGKANFPSPGNNDFATGMGWFPGYAINQETGERLNMAFGEDSYYSSEHGRDMIWNPTSNISVPPGNEPIFGGKHYIYVFGHNNDKTFSSDPLVGNELKDVPRYDKGAMMHHLFDAANTTTSAPTAESYLQEIYADAMWVNIPMLKSGHSLLESDVKIRLRVAKSYQKAYSGSANPAIDIDPTPVNDNYPVYDFNTGDIATQYASMDAATKALDLINVVPNPYYAYSGYELNTLDNIVKITNLPEKCTVTIFSLDGTLIRKFKVDQPTNAKNTEGVAVTSLEWDLKNQVRIPISSGLYIIHVDVPNVGEKTLKWFGVLRPLDLETY